jgi:hypothetical protein
MAEVVKLRSELHAEKDEPDADLIGLLEEFLEKAQAGHIIGLGFAAVAPDGTIFTSWKGHSPRRDVAAAIGLLQHRFNAAWNAVQD